MKDFPLFDTMISSRDVKERIGEHFGIKEKQKEEIVLAFGVKIVVNKMLPPDSALFINRRKRIVAIYRDGELVYSAQRKHERREERDNPRRVREEKRE